MLLHFIELFLTFSAILLSNLTLVAADSLEGDFLIYPTFVKSSLLSQGKDEGIVLVIGCPK